MNFNLGLVSLLAAGALLMTTLHYRSEAKAHKNLLTKATSLLEAAFPYMRMMVEDQIALSDINDELVKENEQLKRIVAANQNAN